ncbi:TetR/AcrR family transcriptional regulator [Streptomyces sp. NPDC087300]|uniref:TetR/AcrR family transcriptional regulator n=1 Tax=Streptomyces sp. NPDC087300 TaxID=3365780 RepID=UPI00380F2670
MPDARSTTTGSASRAVRPVRRADAERSRAAILEAAIQLLGERRDIGMAAIGAAAGVTRQTVYAHFASRDALLSAVVDRLTDRTMAEMDAAAIDEGPAADALLRLLDAGWRTFAEHPFLLDLGSNPAARTEDRARHEPVAERYARLIRRGMESGEFDARLPVPWLVATTVALGHAAGEEVTSGRMPVERAAEVLRVSVLRVVGWGVGEGAGGGAG